MAPVAASASELATEKQLLLLQQQQQQQQQQRDDDDEEDVAEDHCPWGRFARASHLVKHVFNAWADLVDDHRTWRLQVIKACRFKIERVDVRIKRETLARWRANAGFMKHRATSNDLVKDSNEGLPISSAQVQVLNDLMQELEESSQLDSFSPPVAPPKAPLIENHVLTAKEATGGPQSLSTNEALRDMLLAWAEVAMKLQHDRALRVQADRFCAYHIKFRMFRVWRASMRSADGIESRSISQKMIQFE